MNKPRYEPPPCSKMTEIIKRKTIIEKLINVMVAPARETQLRKDCGNFIIIWLNSVTVNIVKNMYIFI